MAFAGCTNEAEQAGKYNDRIIGLSNGCVVRQGDLMEAAAKKDEKLATAALEQLRAYTKLAADTLRTLPAPDQAEALAFKEAAASYFDNLVKTCDKEYAIYIKMHCRPDSLFTENDQRFIDSLAVLINSRDSIADFNFNRAQKVFVQKYGIRLE